MLLDKQKKKKRKYIVKLLAYSLIKKHVSHNISIQ